MTPANITAANTAMGNYFSVSDILYTHPMNPLTTGSGTGATQDMRNYGMVLAAMSQYAQQIGMPISSGMVTVMMNDAADGVMNGMMGSTQIMMGGMGGMMGNNPHVDKRRDEWTGERHDGVHGVGHEQIRPDRRGHASAHEQDEYVERTDTIIRYPTEDDCQGT